MTTTLVCSACQKNNTWNNNQYKQGLFFNCASCSVRLQQIFCPHCSSSNIWSNPKTSVEGRLINCAKCSKSFQFICCPHCQVVNMWSAANYEQGLVYKCITCKQPFQHVSCAYCHEANVYPTAASIQGIRLKCRSCANMHQYIRCPHCQKGQVWKNCNYIAGSAVPCCSCKQNFAYMRCPHCEKANFWKNPLNTTLSLICFQCKKDMNATISISHSSDKKEIDVTKLSNQIQRSLTQLDLGRPRGRRSSLNRNPDDGTPRHQARAVSAHPRKVSSCSYFIECKEYVKNLNWSISFFNNKHDRCYCQSCYSHHLPNTLRVAEADYVVPRGWTGFGLGVDPFRDDDLWNTWIVVYHAIRTGHIPGKIHIYTSPSIRYASLQVYSPLNSFQSPKTGKHYNVQIVLQCKQKPGTFRVQGETIGWGDKRICNIVPNESIEHFTNRRSSVIPYRLLIRLKDKT
ncbi:unnamed protein product [Rotaria sordida]|uniref:Uncharacterized protein n=1 Tax=Rotaria sordida TaxID=392033 RepID=A0A814QBX0_9BILA|nr:unnamed protein product [Rotaria sordida]